MCQSSTTKDFDVTGVGKGYQFTDEPDKAITCPAYQALDSGDKGKCDRKGLVNVIIDKWTKCAPSAVTTILNALKFIQRSTRCIGRSGKARRKTGISIGAAHG